MQNKLNTSVLASSMLQRLESKVMYYTSEFLLSAVSLIPGIWTFAVNQLGLHICSILRLYFVDLLHTYIKRETQQLFSNGMLFFEEMRLYKLDTLFLFFLLSLNWAWAQENEGMLRDETDVNLEINESSISSDIWDELRELRDMMIKQEVDLSYSKTKIENLELETAGNTNTLITIGYIFPANVQYVLIICKISAAQTASMFTLQTRLTATENVNAGKILNLYMFLIEAAQ